jgi:hypothetical protein
MFTLLALVIVIYVWPSEFGGDDLRYETRRIGFLQVKYWHVFTAVFLVLTVLLEVLVKAAIGPGG